MSKRHASLSTLRVVSKECDVTMSPAGDTIVNRIAAITVRTSEKECLVNFSINQEKIILTS